ncbi:hypothetical protein [Pseudoxanthomonas sacheonensis]|uniref:hypothetical protein n=1 Tax=Pseudoxanthomonas sacheonensis TaxID=443615 RepID=UPI0013D820BC|nr:hypothetical protein [Pseudoxanthomonas sacheonensis]
MLVITIAVGSAFDLLVTAAASAVHASLQPATALVGMLAAACGAFVAKRGFVPTAIGVCAAFWALALYHVHKFSFGLTYADLISSNAAPIALSLACAAVGALLGQYLARAGKVHRAVA